MRRPQRRYDLCDTRTLSGRLRLARYCSGLEWKQLAYRTGYSAESVRSWEAGRRSIPAHCIGVLAQAARCSEDWLLTGQGTPPEQHRRYAHVRLDGTIHDLMRGEALAGVDPAKWKATGE